MHASQNAHSEQSDFIALSFQTISSTGPNAAIIHYAPSPTTSSPILASQIYLLDSGGQYRDGTTDVTRTFHFGEPKEEERQAYTRVLKGHVALDGLVFPKGTTGTFASEASEIDRISIDVSCRFSFENGSTHRLRN